MTMAGEVGFGIEIPVLKLKRNKIDNRLNKKFLQPAAQGFVVHSDRILLNTLKQFLVRLPGGGGQARFGPFEPGVHCRNQITTEGLAVVQNPADEMVKKLEGEKLGVRRIDHPVGISVKLLKLPCGSVPPAVYVDQPTGARVKHNGLRPNKLFYPRITLWSGV